MSRIFISHSSRNNEDAEGFAAWLAANGWDDVFLDVDPQRGIAAGERWKTALQRAAHRCEAILALVSRDWIASPWCRAELDAARLMGKRVILCLIGLRPTEVPADLADEQWVDLHGDPRGYDRLRIALRRAGLDPGSFLLPEGRRPYPGFASFEEQDAAIFFGREAQIVRGLDKLRALARTGVERMLVIIGASGAGKSSFLRAGLWPRLDRDDRDWLPLPVIRPERAALSGQFGLAQSLRRILAASRFQRSPELREFPKSLSGIMEWLQTDREALRKMFARLRAAARSTSPDGHSSEPTIILPIDQAEELLNQDGVDEAEWFLEALGDVLEHDPHVILVITIRSDAFPEFQSRRIVASYPKDTFPLDMMLPGSFRTVIEGPAALAKPSPLQIDPELTEELLRDISGQDALPLLAFTLATLHERYSVAGRLTLDDYLVLGRLRGVINSAVEGALASASAAGELPADRRAQLDIIRRAFVPNLAAINQFGQFVKRVSNFDDLPAETHGLIRALGDHRLVTIDLRRSATGEHRTVEVTHEALLREWSDLNLILEQQRSFLRAKAQLEQLADEWRAAPERERKQLLLSGPRLDRAQAWARERPDEFTPGEAAFLKASLRSAKSHGMRLAGAAGVLATVAVAGVGYALFTINAAHGRCPAADAYIASNGRFEREGDRWLEYSNARLFTSYVQVREDKTYVYLQDQQGREGEDGRSFNVRIPKCGGQAEWTWSNPIQYGPFQEVRRGRADYSFAKFLQWFRVY